MIPGRQPAKAIDCAVMRSELARTLRTLLDASGGLGVGLVDANGLLVHSEGEHAGLVAGVVAAELATLWGRRFSGLERALQDDFAEQIVIGERHAIFTLLLPSRYLFYVLVAREPQGRIRPLLQEAAAQLTTLLRGGLVEATRQRLEQPRQFSGSSWLR